MQQGRVQVDADWNEMVDILNHRIETETVDAIGNGAPIHNAGFKITLNANVIEIGAGRYYVDGIMCENENMVTITAQPGWPANSHVVKIMPSSTSALPPPAGTYVAYLDVWPRHVTALEDVSIREVALGGPDTGTREKNMWQVFLLRVGNIGLNSNCLTAFPDWTTLTAAPTGKMAARSQPAAVSTDPCIVEPGAGYGRLENQLYRVEIHKGGPKTSATFKWSRDNASIVARWESQDVDKLTISSIGKDDVLSFASGQWVELIDEKNELFGNPGTLVKIKKAEGNVLTIDPATAIPAAPILKTNFPDNARIRRWDSPGEVSMTNAWMPLESGVEVQFGTGTYQTGDYWMIPARTAIGDVQWPKTSPNVPTPLLPHGTDHHYSRLALLEFNAGTWTTLSDCRDIFPPLTELTSLFYISGDGQEAMPDPTAPDAFLPLAQTLRAGVSNGQWPVEKAAVRFQIVDGSGQLNGIGASAVVETNNAGIAECNWELDSKTLNQSVTAMLLDASGTAIHIPVGFNANLSVAGQVAYDPKECGNLAGVKTVEEALDKLCEMGGGVSPDPGVHITGVRIIDGPPIINDTRVKFPEFIKGVMIECDDELVPFTIMSNPDMPVRRPVCRITLELPYNLPDRDFWGFNERIGYTPLILDGDLQVAGNQIFWKPTDSVRTFITQLLFDRLTENNFPPIVLGWVTLLGNFTWSQNNPEVFVDGDSFGFRTEASISSPTQIRFPTGDDRRGGDFRLWFYLTR
jgi:hypothetical protein